MSVLMEAETLGMALSLGWRVHMRCSGFQEGTRSMRRFVYRKQLDLGTLVCMRGPNFPLSRVATHVPKLRQSAGDGVFEPPTNAQVGSG